MSNRIYSRSEVLSHNKPGDCYLIIKNSVYDLTEFIKQHPGGADILTSRAGEDATSYFLNRHSGNHSVINHLEKYKVGELAAEERIDEKFFLEPFYQDLMNICYKGNLFNVDPKIKFFYDSYRLICITMFMAISLFILFFNDNILIALPLITFLSLIGTSIFGFIAHENTHRNFPKNSLVRLLLKITWPIFWPFISQNPLRYEHNSHHIKIGDPEYDYEVAAFSEYIRYTGLVKHKPIHKYQHKLAVFFYPFYANIITTIGGIKSGFWKKHKRSVSTEHSLSVLATLTFYIVFPYFYTTQTSLFYFISAYLLYQSMLFFGIYTGSAINHFTTKQFNKIPESKQNLYGYYNCSQTTNFAVGSKIWFFLTGGFNIQIEHHLVPFIPVENLRRAVPIVKDLCQKYDYPYVSFPNFKALWDDHYKYLKTLSKANDLDLIKSEIINKNTYNAR